MKIYDDITKTTGNTPLVWLRRISQGNNARVAVKLESRNPLGSIKDRIAVNMIETAEKQGKLKPGGLLVEPTSGNTGLGLAMAAAAKGYRLIIIMPDSMSVERQKLLKALGAELILTPGGKGMNGAIQTANQILKKNPGAVMLQQFENPANPAIHERATASEIWDDTDGEVDIIVAGVGTGGTITGLARALKKKKPEILAVAVEPKASAVLSGSKPGTHRIAGIGAGFVPKVLDVSLIDKIVKVGDHEAAETARRLAREEGIFAGISSGAAAFAALKMAGLKKNRGKLIVAILPDTGERYLSTWLYDENG